MLKLRKFIKNDMPIVKKESILLSAHRKFNLLLSDLVLSSKIEPFLEQMVDMVESFLPGSKVSILTLNQQQGTLHTGIKNNLPDFYNEAVNGIKIGKNVGSCGAAAFLNKTIIASNINEHPNWKPFLAVTQKANLHSCWSVPYTDSNSNVLGTFAIYHNEPKSPSDIEEEIVNVAALIISVAYEKLILEEQLRFSATHDELTKLHNRTYLNEVATKFLSLCLRKNLKSSLLFIDLDKFKLVNDNLGHKVGDDLLVLVSDVISQQVRDCDIASRFGGDEFIIVMENTHTRDGTQVANRLHDAIMAKVPSDILDLGFGVSIGVATSTEENQALDQLIQKADQAMYHAKQHRLGVYSDTSL
ncbi:diguanylate cyclase [Photobacterium sp. GB-72]|nr:diguanylate cyclase [Photobacterium sp. GB-72]